MIHFEKFLILLLTLSAAVTSATAANDFRKYHDELSGQNICDSVIIFSAESTLHKSKAIEIRGNCAASRKGKADPSISYGIIWGNDSTGARYQAMLRADGSSDFGDVIDRPAIILTVEHIDGKGISETILCKKLYDDIELVRCNNTIAAEIDCTSGKVEILAGDSDLKSVASVRIEAEKAALPIGVVTVGCPEIEIVVSEYIPDRESALSTGWTLEKLKEYFSDPVPNAPIEGFWKYLDRDNDPRYCRPGGNYTLAIVSDSHGGYDIIYIDGAGTRASLWKSGMLKGHLEPTQFKNHYNLLWYDATMNEISEECSATVEQDAILRCDFPLLKTAIRYSKTPKDM